MLVFTLIFDLLWKGRGSALRSVYLLGFCELKWIEKHGVVSWAARYGTCVLCYFGLEKLKEESYIGHFDNGSKITKKNPSFYKTTRFAKKKSYYYPHRVCLSVCTSA